MNKKNFCRRITIDIPLFADSSEPNAGIKITVDGPPEQLALPIDTPAPAGRLADSADKFITNWLSGKLRIGVQPVLSTALFEMYERSSHNSTDQKGFVRALRRHGVALAPGRFIQGKRLRQAQILFPPGAVRPHGVTRTAWLTKHIEEFNQARPAI